MQIQYNLLNLPSKTTFSDGGSINYQYSASGMKQMVWGSAPGQGSKSQFYLGNYVYSNGVKQLLVDGGYVTFSGTTPQYHFYVKDHLGNNRMVVNASGTVEQVSHYYAFGGLMGENTGSDLQDFKYNGKELDRLHGLDWYDYNARHMDAVRGVFTTMDPLAEKYYDISPYVSCLDNPIRLIDIKGLEPGDFFNSIIEAAKDFGSYYSKYSIRDKTEFASYIMFNPQKKKYYYPRAISGEHNKIRKEISLMASHKKVATIHTHGAYEEDLVKNDVDWNDEFSGMEKTPELNKVHISQDRYDDISSANERGIDSYLVTPNGNLKKYDPKTGKIKTISSDIPSDKNAGDRRANNIDPEKESEIIKLINRILSYLK